MAARVLLFALLGAWVTPAALGDFVSPLPLCCRRGGHHCPLHTHREFRDAKLHCHNCRGLVTPAAAPPLLTRALGVSRSDAHPYIHEFASAFSPRQEIRNRSQRAPPAQPAR